MSARTLFRPVGVGELDLILESDARQFPPRLPEQPVFYPVLTREYAEQIARDWSTSDPRSGCAGLVTEFEVLAAIARVWRHEDLPLPTGELVGAAAA